MNPWHKHYPSVQSLHNLPYMLFQFYQFKIGESDFDPFVWTQMMYPLLASSIQDKITHCTCWLPVHILADASNYQMWFTEKGYEQYQNTLMPFHEFMFGSLTTVMTHRTPSSNPIVYQDEYSIVFEKVSSSSPHTSKRTFPSNKSPDIYNWSISMDTDTPFGS